jgi:hypothetical protein
VPDEADIRDPENICNQFWLRGTLSSGHGSQAAFPVRKR